MTTHPIASSPMSDADILVVGNKWAKEPGFMEFERNDFIGAVRECLQAIASHTAQDKAVSDEVKELHIKLAGETLRADQGWERYEAANKDRNALRAALAASPQLPVADEPAAAMPIRPTVPDHIINMIREYGDMRSNGDFSSTNKLGEIVNNLRNWAAPDAGLAEDAWLPISTAPKDGRKIIVCVDGQEPMTARWRNNQWEKRASSYLAHSPTYWMPMLAAPTQGTKQ